MFVAFCVVADQAFSAAGVPGHEWAILPVHNAYQSVSRQSSMTPGHGPGVVDCVLLPSYPSIKTTGEIVMSQIIGFLEEMGRNPACGCIPDADYMAAVGSLQASPAERQALLARDHGALSDLLGGRQRMVCTIWQPLDEPEPRREDDEGANVPDSQPSPEEEEELKDH